MKLWQFNILIVSVFSAPHFTEMECFIATIFYIVMSLLLDLYESKK